MGIVQGLTEFLPVSSSGHLEIASVLLGTKMENNLAFATAVHGGTVLSTIVVFWKEVTGMLSGFFKFRNNAGMRMAVNILVSMLPVLVVGMFFKDRVETLFTGNLALVGAMLIVTACLLAFSGWFKPKETGREITMKDAFIIGLAQAVAVLPGLSRSGSTISTGLLLGVKRNEVASFSFLMVLIPIIGINLLDIIGGDFGAASADVGAGPLLCGFLAAFVSGVLACKVMVNLVKRGKLIWFAAYCFIMGVAAVIYSLA